MNKVAAVVVTYNRIELLKQCIDCLLKQTVCCDILIVDNNSTDGTSEWLDDLTVSNIDIHVTHLPQNTGGAGGFNYGMRWAVEANYEFVWVMDDDCLTKPNSLEMLLGADDSLNGNYGWLSSLVLWIDGTICEMNRPKLYRGQNDKIIQKAKQATFVSCLFKSNTIRELGLPISDFFIWGDDIEYTRRISVRSKYPSYIVSNSIVIHAMKNNVGSNIALADIATIDRYNYAFRNENYLYRKEGLLGIVYFFAKCSLNMLRILAFAKSNKGARALLLIRQFLMGFKFNPEIEYIRH